MNAVSPVIASGGWLCSVAIHHCCVHTCSHPAQPLAGQTYWTTNFLIGDTESIPAVISGCFAGCILRPPFLKSVLQQLLTPAGLNHWSTSRKSRNFSTVLVWCPWFAYILSKLPPFLSSSEKLQMPNHPVRHFSKVNFWEKLLAKKI